MTSKDKGNDEGAHFRTFLTQISFRESVSDGKRKNETLPSNCQSYPAASGGFLSALLAAIPLREMVLFVPALFFFFFFYCTPPLLPYLGFSFLAVLFPRSFHLDSFFSFSPDSSYPYLSCSFILSLLVHLPSSFLFRFLLSVSLLFFTLSVSHSLTNPLQGQLDHS